MARLRIHFISFSKYEKGVGPGTVPLYRYTKLAFWEVRIYLDPEEIRIAFKKWAERGSPGLASGARVVGITSKRESCVDGI